MKESTSYVGFTPLPDKETIVSALINDPPEIRWRIVRGLFRLTDSGEREEIIEQLRPHLFETDDFRVQYRINLALQALHRPMPPTDYTLVKGRGVLRDSEGKPQSQFLPVVDFHIHPKSPDMKFLVDLKEAGVTHAVILATDTDPRDVERPEIRDEIKKNYAQSTMAHRLPFDRLLKQIQGSLYSPSHVTNQDVADWVADYPEQLKGFGSVNLSRDKDYVLSKLDEIDSLKMHGVKLLPHSQFFNPAENENVHLLFEFCQERGLIVLSHTGCGPGPFEVIELSRNSHPDQWEPVVRKYPNVPLVLAHFGAYSTEIPGIWLHEAMQLAQKHRNVYADLAAVDWVLSREIVVKEIRKTIGFNRILFASDYPLPLVAGESLAYLVSRVKANTYMTDKEKRLVLGDNAARLLGLS